jgi:hypothetical protein
MTNYRLEEFKAWLEEEPARKKNLDWERFYQYFKNDSTFTDFIPRGTSLLVNYSRAYWQPWHEVVWNWLTRETGELKEQIEKLTRELQTERESTQQALQTSQEWHERQKAELIAQWKAKLQTFINQRKTQLHQEIELIKEVLND